MLLFVINFNMRQHHYKRLRRAGARRGLFFFALLHLSFLYFLALQAHSKAPQ